MPRRFQIIQGQQPVASEQEESRSLELPIFEEALLAHLDSMFAFAMRLVGGRRERAEDLVQETALRAFRGYGSLRSPKKTKTWLFQILYNTQINEFHRQSRQPTADVELNEALLESMETAPSATPEEQFFAQLLGSELQQALEDLPIEFRTTIWLSDIEELSYKEISEITNCPAGTVASRLYRGHRLLRERLREYAGRRGLLRE
ncbi:MAG: sigma-70 family RNA polymerase sigma factor [Pyrinomonadaceae bacterium]|nr:sigma-70 family RNA polymerase sigma factor [Pyrinomonadaceae bacterium]